jgi:hypothetical protein
MPIRPQGLKLFTNSRSRTARRCLRLHFLMYDLGWRSTAESDPLKFGQLGHDALEVWLIEHIDDPDVRDEHWRRIWARRGVAVEGVGRAEWAPDPLGCALDAIAEADAGPYMKARARAAMRVYHERWAPSMGEYRVIAVEVEFIVPLRNPDTNAASRTWALGGKIDALVEEREARIVAPWEHKTTSKDLTEGGRYWKRLRMDGQLSQYIRGARASHSLLARAGHRVVDEGGRQLIDRSRYDVIKRPDYRPGKATPEGERQYTKPKSKLCPACRKKGGAQPPHQVDGAIGTCQPDPEGGDKRIVITDAGGKLYANQRVVDESPEEFEERVYAEIVADPQRFFVRDAVTRTEAELAAHEADTWSLAKIMHAGALSGGELAPRNVDACDGEDGPCDFLDVCYYGMGALEDASLFRRVENVHEELFDIAEPPLVAPGSNETQEEESSL